MGPHQFQLDEKPVSLKRPIKPEFQIPDDDAQFDKVKYEPYKARKDIYKTKLAKYERQEKAFSDIITFIQDIIVAYNVGFTTSFGALDHAEAMTATLFDRSFKHSLGSNSADRLDLYVNSDSDPFAYIATERYNSSEFYGIMTDTGASKHSTAGYGQYLAYQ